MPRPLTIQTRDLGRAAYAPVLDLQRDLNQQVIDGQAPPTILLVEHDPVITLTRRKNVRDHLLASDDQLKKIGVETHDTDRGGDITYHGPGQLVVYPILKLGDFGLNLSTYMRLLERVVIDTAARFNIQAHRDPDATGVWVDTQRVAGDAQRLVKSLETCSAGMKDQTNTKPITAPPNPQPPTPNPHAAKLCAMGVRIRKNTTMHGLALNVAPDLTHFDLIVPCGLKNRSVTSMKQLLGSSYPTMQQVKKYLDQTLRDTLLREDKPVCCEY